MSVAHPFAGFNPKPTIWGYNWTAPDPAPPPKVVSPPPPPSSAQSPPLVDQYANIPAALISTLKREKKPFTYTPGGVNLSEVLNQRLQKRMERKKRYSEERAAPRQLIVAPTHNTPLHMYSDENALEAMVAQAELVAADNSLSARSATLPRNHTFRFDADAGGEKGVAQSKAFRVLQIITDTEEAAGDRVPTHSIDEMRFTGLRENKADIPSRFFHQLQRMTGTEDDQEDVPPPRVVQQPVPSRGPSSAPTSGGLKRPAAFLPIKTSPGFRPVSFLSNGPTQHRNATGTDF